MDRPQYYIGIDVASATFTSAVGVMGQRWQIVSRPTRFDNQYDSFPQFLHWLHEQGCQPLDSLICMEATGVYNEVLALFLAANGYRVVVEAPLKVKRAFHPEGHKSDPVDSQQIAEYAYRFYDQLTPWRPRAELLEQIKALLTLREQFVREKTGHLNAWQALKRKAVRVTMAEQLHEQAIAEIKVHIHALEVEIQRLIDQDPHLRQLLALLTSIPGVGLLLGAHMLVLLQSAPRAYTAKSLAAFIGICPYEHSSGSSVQHGSTSRHYGPSVLRKLFGLAARSIATHQPQYRLYYLRKVQQGKPKTLVLNNLANKLLEVMVAVLRSNTPFIPNYHSVHPGRLKTALTKS